jgi:tetratricopeptide (TPR) repeat protein
MLLLGRHPTRFSRKAAGFPMIKCAPVLRSRIIPAIILLAALSAHAGVTIYLKNGRKIVADEAVEKRDTVQYTIEGGQYAIPKSLVDHIESPDTKPLSGDAVLPAAVASTVAPATLSPAPSNHLPAADRLIARVVQGDKVNDDALATIERAGNADETAAAFFAAGRFEFERGNRDRARFYFERATSFAPQNDIVLSHYAATLIQLGRANEAVPYAERAARLAPNSADAFTVLGFAYYGSNGDARAIQAWKRALELRPDGTLQQYLAKAEREEKTESDFREAETGHFVLHFEGSTTAPTLRASLQAELESAYNDLVNALGVAPRATIAVSLYTNQAFFDVTQAPAWSGAINDGRLRIPVQGLTEVTPELRRVLRHELTHSFINQIAGGRCPQWLNEGIAQLMEPRTIGNTRGPRLAHLYAQGGQIPLSSLEVSFLNFSPFEAVLAYDESLAAVEYIRDAYGMSELQSLLRKIGEGSSTESALRLTLHSGYAGMEDEIAQFLNTKYGK